MRMRSAWCIGLLLTPIVCLLGANPLWGEVPDGLPVSGLPKVVDYATYYDANQLLMFNTNTGSFAFDKTGLLGKPDGLHYPWPGNKTVLYAAGLWVGARVDGQTRVAISEYSDEYVPGLLGANPFDPRFHVYKLERGDSPMSNPDYAAWPFGDGAPALKAADGTDSLDAAGHRIPRIIGDQTLWSVFNDGDPSAHYSNSGSTDPLAIEVRNTAFGFSRSNALGRVVFMQWTITNAGPRSMDDAYVAFWADPDIGHPTDDLAGCDPALGLGYAYNDDDDVEYGPMPPAVGFVVLQGPMVPASNYDTAYAFGQTFPGMRNLPMTAFQKYVNGEDPGNGRVSYYHMQGLDRFGNPRHDPWGNTTTYMYSGDPVAQTGWYGGYPEDCRYLVCTGPFALASGDSQEVIIAVCVGQGSDALASITDLRATALVAKAAYDARFDIPPEQPPPPVVLDIMPGQCPNILVPTPTLRMGGLSKTSPLLPVADDPIATTVTFAICGTPALDVRSLNPGTLTLAGVPAKNVRFRDVTSPGVPDNPCDCLRGGPDGIVDLVAEVDRTQFYDALGSPSHGELVEVLMGALLKDGRAVDATDCISVHTVRVKDIDFNIVETAGSGGVPVSPPDNVAYSLNSTGDWYVSSDQEDNFLRMDWREKSKDGEAWEIRFNGTGSEYYNFNTDITFVGRAPFEVWNLGINTPGDPSDDRRVQFEVLDDDESGGWSMGDRLYVVEADYSEPLPSIFDFDAHWPHDFHIGRIIFMDNSGNGRPVNGTVVRFTAHEFYVTSATVAPLPGVRRTALSETTTAGTRLDANYPNPFNAATTISYHLEQEGHVSLEVFNVLGQRTVTLVDGVQAAGTHAVVWAGKDTHGDDVASGMYFYRLRTDVGVLTKKMVLLK